MKLHASLDVDVVAHETGDEVAVLVDLAAPAATDGAVREPGSLQVVLDRSGSMAGPPLEGAKRALLDLVQRLEPTDLFGLVAFDSEAQVVVPAGPLSDKTAVGAAIRGIVPGGTTDLGAGYLRGLRERRRVAGESGSGGTLLLVSDGHANLGVTDADQLASVARNALADGTVSSTLGYGLGYDETLLTAVARAGSGNHEFAADPDTAGAAIAREVDGLLDKVVQAVTLTVDVEPAVSLLRLYNDLPTTAVGSGAVMIELGDLYAEESRRLLLRLSVPAVAALGLATVATLRLQYVELPGLVEHTVTVPVVVNVVPGDEASARVPDPTVTSEVLLQEAQESKKRASEHFERGDRDAGLAALAETRDGLRAAASASPDPVASGIEAEQADVEALAEAAEEADARYLSKRSRASYHAVNRKRGRTDRRPDGPPDGR